MFTDIEETLGRELHDVADGLTIPAMPALPHESPRTTRRWQPMLAAAAVVLMVAGAVAVATIDRGEELQPAPPAPTTTDPGLPEPQLVSSIPRTPPKLPYVQYQRLYVDGEQIPGDWLSVWGTNTGWLAWRSDYTFWWGNGRQLERARSTSDTGPVISQNGEYVAALTRESGEGLLTGFETRVGGEGLGGLPIDLGSRQDGSQVTIRAVTNDGKVIAQGSETSVLWLPHAGDGVKVDLTETAPGQFVLGVTPTGLMVVVEGSDEGDPYLAELSDSGELTKVATPVDTVFVDLPRFDDLAASTDGSWLVYTEFGTTQGEVTTLPSLRARSVDGARQVTLTPPDGWFFKIRDWAWEDDNYLVATVLSFDEDGKVRCSPALERCVLIDAG
ncbi:MAG TPA: hypothetical protein VLI04_21350 [Nocardioidaceae bacterium]|nr:hypothetical protein [Nocardioidaceae bacterium]